MREEEHLSFASVEILYSAVGAVSRLWVRSCGGLILQMPDQLWDLPCILFSGYRFYFLTLRS